MKTAELTGAALDWAVAKCEGHDTEFAKLRSDLIYVLVWKCCPLTGDKEVQHEFEPSTDWSQGGPIIQRENLELVPLCPGTWRAISVGRDWYNGRTPLEAAMRCYVASKLGDEVDVPAELLS